MCGVLAGNLIMAPPIWLGSEPQLNCLCKAAPNVGLRIRCRDSLNCHDSDLLIAVSGSQELKQPGLTQQFREAELSHHGLTQQFREAELRQHGRGRQFLEVRRFSCPNATTRYVKMFRSWPEHALFRPGSGKTTF